MDKFLDVIYLSQLEDTETADKFEEIFSPMLERLKELLSEKLFEERLMDEEGMQKTPNGLINIAQPIKFDEESFWNTLDNLYSSAYEETDGMKPLVKQLVPTYKIDERN